jgi:hypothetical protein
MRYVSWIVTLIAVDALLSVACGAGAKRSPEMKPGTPVKVDPNPTMTPVPSEPAMVAEAKKSFPRLIDLHAGVIARTCSPNPGVCHQSNNYPDMRTAGGFLALVKAPCNIQIPDHSQGWDGCEVEGDRLTISGARTEIAWIEKRGSGSWHVAFKDPSPVSGRIALAVYTSANDTVLVPPPEWDVGITLATGQREGDIDVPAVDGQYLIDFVDTALATVVGGDPNRNGIWGASDANVHHGAVIEPGSLEQSYLWGRITGTVPGTRMPLANKPLSNAEYVALACWIEGLDGHNATNADATIDYQSCAFAKNPTAYSILPEP